MVQRVGNLKVYWVLFKNPNNEQNLLKNLKITQLYAVYQSENEVSLHMDILLQWLIFSETTSFYDIFPVRTNNYQ